MKRLVLQWIALCALLVSGAHAAPQSELDARATGAYRAEDYAAAAALWNDALDAATGALDQGAPHAGDGERARLMANLGNCAARQDDWAQAAAWFEASLRLRPRDAETRDKLDFARSEAGWSPLDRGDLASTTERALSAFTEDEARWLALVALLPLVVTLLGEALRGSRAWRRAALACAALWLFACTPCIYAAWTADSDPVLVTNPNGAAARPEPRESAERLERLPAGTHWKRLDELPGWTRLRGPDGRSVWVPSRDVFALER
ncbi:MAG: hypothetical protein KDC14_03175 [Planctomycetes bacterium]|nr:hypothetical protein [Planctomycetota bacterium]